MFMTGENGQYMGLASALPSRNMSGVLCAKGKTVN